MNVKFTARHFRPHPDVKEHALDTVKKLDKFYDGIVTRNVILSYERATNSVKTAEINLQVYGTRPHGNGEIRRLSSSPSTRRPRS